MTDSGTQPLHEPLRRGPAPRPLVTFILLAYNQAEFIEEAIEGALAQTYSPLEIIVSDDCSPDDTHAIAARFLEGYHGPHRVIVRRNERNLGLIGHLCTVMREVRGELVVAAAGDDVSYPDRVAKVVDAWIANGRRSGSIFSRYKIIDADGTITCHRSSPPVNVVQLPDCPTEELESVSVGTLGCSHAWTRDVFDVFGDIDPRAIHEDVTIPLRSLLIGSIVYMPEELVLYRLRMGSLSRHSFTGHRDRMRQMAHYWAGRVANYEQFEKDAAVALQKKLIGAEVADSIKRFIKAKEDIARQHVQFFSSGPFTRFKVPLHSWRSVPWSQTLKWLVIAVAPWSYGFKLPRFAIRRGSGMESVDIPS